MSTLQNKKQGTLIPVVIFLNGSESKCKAGSWDDNGGESDGFGYVNTRDCILETELNLLIEKSEVEINDHGVMIDNYEPHESLSKENIKGRWTGFSSSKTAFFENEEGADSYYLANEIAGKSHDFEIEDKSTGRKIYLYRIDGGFIEEQENNELNFTDLSIEEIKDYYNG